MRKIIYSELPFRRLCEGVAAPIKFTEFCYEITKARSAPTSCCKA
nr:MAG TPA_asm: tRNA-dihydrouridine(20) synthase [Caudoviricetes sp.]